jgi:branched-chain amino acid transport system permease protein
MFGVLIAALIALPFIASSYFIHLTNLALLACIAALALNMVTGYTGQVSLGHGGFLAAGAFTVAILGERWGVSPLFVVPMAAVVGGVLGLLTGLPSLRLSGVYVLLSTLAMHFVIILGVTVYQYYGAGFAYSISIASPKIGPWLVNSTWEWYILLVIVTMVATVFCTNLVRSRIGRAWMGIRDRDTAAWMLGVNIGYYKVMAFIFSSALAAVAGALTAYYMQFASFDTYTIWVGVLYLAIIAIGGMGSILGSILGALFITYLTPAISAAFEVLTLPGQIEANFPAVQLALYGLLIVLFLLLEPLGLVGIWLRIRYFFELWPFKFRRVIATTR